MTITISVWLVLIFLVWVSIGAVFAWKMAISPQAVLVLVVAWPLFLVLIILAKPINWWVNREFKDN